MNQKQAERLHTLASTLETHGFTFAEVNTLLRCERTIHRWAEDECNGNIQRDDKNKPRRYYGPNHQYSVTIVDREAGALKRAQAIAKAHGLTIYHQGDPRGCALYLRPGNYNQKAMDDWNYSNGIAITIGF